MLCVVCVVCVVCAVCCVLCAVCCVLCAVRCVLRVVCCECVEFCVLSSQVNHVIAWIELHLRVILLSQLKPDIFLKSHMLHDSLQ